MTTLNEVLALAIEGYDPDAFYTDGEQIIKESLTAFCQNPFFLQNTPAEDILTMYRRDFVGWYPTPEEVPYANVWESDGYYFKMF